MNEAFQLRIKKIKEYRENNNIPNFSNPEDYWQWLETAEGKEYAKALENIRKEVKTHGGFRPNSGRKKLYENRTALNKRVPNDTVIIIKDFSKSHNISENEAIVKLINAGYQSLEKQQNFG